jgi:hypothetical protein
VCQLRRDIVHRRGLEMVHLLEVRRDEQRDDRVMAQEETLKS